MKKVLEVHSFTAQSLLLLQRSLSRKCLLKLPTMGRKMAFNTRPTAAFSLFVKASDNAIWGKDYVEDYY